MGSVTPFYAACMNNTVSPGYAATAAWGAGRGVEEFGNALTWMGDTPAKYAFMQEIACVSTILSRKCAAWLDPFRTSIDYSIDTKRYSKRCLEIGILGFANYQLNALTDRVKDAGIRMQSQETQCAIGDHLQWYQESLLSWKDQKLETNSVSSDEVHFDSKEELKEEVPLARNDASDLNSKEEV